MEAKQRLWHTADKKRLVKDGDPKAAFLYCTPGDTIPDSAAKMYGLVDGQLKGSKAPAKDKAQKPEADKAQKPEADKASKGGLTIKRAGA